MLLSPKGLYYFIFFPKGIDFKNAIWFWEKLQTNVIYHIKLSGYIVEKLVCILLLLKPAAVVEI